MRVRASWQRAGASKGVFTVTVRDTGPGIAAAELDRIFAAFYQAFWGKQRLSVPAAFDAARTKVQKEGFGPAVWAGFVLYTSGRQ